MVTTEYPDLPFDQAAPSVPYFDRQEDDDGRRYSDVLFDRGSALDEEEEEEAEEVLALGSDLKDTSESESQPVQPAVDSSSSSEDSEDLGEGRREALRGVGRVRGRGRGRGRGAGRGRGRGSRGGRGRGRAGDTDGAGTVSRGGAPGRPSTRGMGRSKGRASRKHVVVPDAQFQEEFNKATDAFLEKDYALAADLVEDCIQLNPEVFAAWNLLSQIHTATGQHEESLQALWYGAPTARDGGVWWDIVHRIEKEISETGQDRTEDFRTCYTNIITLDENDYEARRRRLEIYIQDPISAKASRECKRMLKIWPQDLEILGTYAESALDCKDHQQIFYAKRAFHYALERYQKDEPDGTKSDFDFPDLDLYLDLLKALRHWEEGLTVFNQCSRWLLGRKEDRIWKDLPDDDREWDLDDEPRRTSKEDFVPGKYPLTAYGRGIPSETRVKLGLFRLNLGREHFREAMQHFEWLRPVEKGIGAPIYEKPEVFAEVGDTLFKCQRWLSALRYYNPLVDTKAAIEPTRRARIARAYQEIGDIEKAIQHYEAFLESAGREEDVLLEVATLYNQIDNKEKAAEYTQRVLALRQGKADRDLDQEMRERIREEARRRVEQATSQQAHPPANSNTVNGTPIKSESQPASLPPLLPKPVRAAIVESRRGIKMGMKEQQLPVPAQLLHLQMQLLQPRMREGDEQATTEWIRYAEQMLNHFANVPAMFPKDRGKHPRYKKHGTKTDAIDLDASGTSEEVTIVPTIEGQGDTDSNENEQSIESEPPFGMDVDFTETRTYQLLSLRDWLDLFLTYALTTAERHEKDHSYSALHCAEICGPFASTPSYDHQIHVVWLQCALILDDATQLSHTVRWFVKTYPFESNTFGLYNAMHALLPTKNGKAYGDKSHLLFFKRFVRMMDFALLSPAERESAEAHFTEEERAAALDPRKLSGSRHLDAEVGNPYGIGEPNTELLLLMGDLLKSGGNYEEALQHYLRAYAVEPGNAVTALSICTTYSQMAVNKECEDRHAMVLKGQAFLGLYKELRLRGVDAQGRPMSAKTMKRRREEAAFNEGRFYHGLGLLHLAVPAYERCLAVVEEEQPVSRAVNDAWVSVDAEGDISMRDVTEEDATTEDAGKNRAAYALQQIFISTGDMDGARRVTEEWLDS